MSAGSFVGVSVGLETTVKADFWGIATTLVSLYWSFATSLQHRGFPHPLWNLFAELTVILSRLSNNTNEGMTEPLLSKILILPTPLCFLHCL